MLQEAQTKFCNEHIARQMVKRSCKIDSESYQLLNMAFHDQKWYLNDKICIQKINYIYCIKVHMNKSYDHTLDLLLNEIIYTHFSPYNHNSTYFLARGWPKESHWEFQYRNQQLAYDYILITTRSFNVREFLQTPMN